MGYQPINRHSGRKFAEQRRLPVAERCRAGTQRLGQCRHQPFEIGDGLIQIIAGRTVDQLDPLQHDWDSQIS